MFPRIVVAGLFALLAFTAPAFAQPQYWGYDYTQEDADLLERCMAQVGNEPSTQALADCIGVAANQCQDEPGGASTAGIVECLARENAWWDALLNTSYAELRDALDADRANSLREAQRAWIAFRDADCAFQYDLWREGTMRSIAGASCHLDHTARRAITLTLTDMM